MILASRTSAHICNSLANIESALEERERLWARIDPGDGESAFVVVTCGDSPDAEPDGEFFTVGETRVYCSSEVAAFVVGALVGESVDEYDGP